MAADTAQAERDLSWSLCSADVCHISVVAASPFSVSPSTSAGSPLNASLSTAGVLEPLAPAPKFDRMQRQPQASLRPHPANGSQTATPPGRSAGRGPTPPRGAPSEHTESDAEENIRSVRDDLRSLLESQQNNIATLRESFQQELTKWATAQRCLESRVNEIQQAAPKRQGCLQIEALDSVVQRHFHELDGRLRTIEARSTGDSSLSGDASVALSGSSEKCPARRPRASSVGLGEQQQFVLRDRLGKIEGILSEAIERQAKELGAVKEELRSEVQARLWEYHGSIRDPSSSLRRRLDQVEATLGADVPDGADTPMGHTVGSPGDEGAGVCRSRHRVRSRCPSVLDRMTRLEALSKDTQTRVEQVLAEHTGKLDKRFASVEGSLHGDREDLQGRIGGLGDRLNDLLHVVQSRLQSVESRFASSDGCAAKALEPSHEIEQADGQEPGVSINIEDRLSTIERLVGDLRGDLDRCSEVIVGSLPDAIGRPLSKASKDIVATKVAEIEARLTGVEGSFYTTINGSAGGANGTRRNSIVGDRISLTEQALEELQTTVASNEEAFKQHYEAVQAHLSAEKNGREEFENSVWRHFEQVEIQGGLTEYFGSVKQKINNDIAGLREKVYAENGSNTRQLEALQEQIDTERRSRQSQEQAVYARFKQEGEAREFQKQMMHDLVGHEKAAREALQELHEKRWQAEEKSRDDNCRKLQDDIATERVVRDQSVIEMKGSLQAERTAREKLQDRVAEGWTRLERLWDRALKDKTTVDKMCGSTSRSTKNTETISANIADAEVENEDYCLEPLSRHSQPQPTSDQIVAEPIVDRGAASAPRRWSGPPQEIHPQVLTGRSDLSQRSCPKAVPIHRESPQFFEGQLERQRWLARRPSLPCVRSDRRLSQASSDASLQDRPVDQNQRSRSSLLARARSSDGCRGNLYGYATATEENLPSTGFRDELGPRSNVASTSGRRAARESSWGSNCGGEASTACCSSRTSLSDVASLASCGSVLSARSARSLVSRGATGPGAAVRIVASQLHLGASRVPRTLRVESPNGHLSCIGEFALIEGELRNGFSIWKQKVGNRWIYTGTDGRWYLGGDDAREAGFQCCSGVVYSCLPHGGLSPDLVRNGWSRKYGSGYYEDHSIRITAIPDPHPPMSVRLRQTE